MRFRIRAVGSAGDLHELELDAPNEAAVHGELQGRGLRALSVRARWVFGGDRRAAPVEVRVLAQELASLLEAGLPVIEALDLRAQTRQSSPSSSRIAQALSTSVRQGLALSQAMQRLGPVFDPLLVAMVRANERTGSVAAALRQFVQYSTQADALRSRVKSAAIYPLVLLGAGTAVTAFLALYVVPRFAEMVEGSGRPLPVASRALYASAQFFVSHAPSIAVLLTAAVGAAFIRLRHAGAHSAVQRILLSVPGLRDATHAAIVARFLFTVGTLLRSGLDLTHSLELAAGVVPASRRAAVSDAIERVAAGERLSAALSSTGMKTDVSTRLLEVGERSGDVSALMLQAARHEEERIARFVARFVQLAEPLLLLAIGLLVGTIVVLLYLPIFELTQWAE